ncbi:MAG: helix-turn-helix transcriptional regulator [Solimonas sp.]
MSNDQGTVRPPAETLIAGIYQAALEQPPWLSFLHALRRALRLRHASISFFTRAGFRDVRSLTISSGAVDLDYESMRERYVDWAALDPLRYETLEDGRVHLNSEADYAARGADAQAFFRGFMAPYGFHHHASIKPHIREGSYCGLLVCARGAVDGAYTADERALMETLNSHLGHALQHFSTVKHLELERDLYEHTIDNLSVGSLLVDREARILRCNPCAERLLARSAVLDIVNGRLAIAEAARNTELRKLVQRLAQPPHTGEIQVLRLACRGGEDLRLMLKPVPPSVAYYHTQSPQVMVYLQDASAQSAAPAGLVAELFGLTRAEAALAICLARGLTLQQAARELHVSEHTARNYSKRVFAKTGTRRQVELVRVMLHSVALLAAG